MKNLLLALLISGASLSTTSCDKIEDYIPAELTEAEIAEGLKSALNVATDTCVTETSKKDGYFGNLAIKILLPQEAKDVESTMRSLGLGSLVDNTVKKLNEAAELAAASAKPIFIDAITGITIDDAKGILFGGDSLGATNYLEAKTYTSLSAAFSPIIKKSLDEVGVATVWNELFTTYNKIPLVKKVNPDLDTYATEKALDGLFYMVGQEEAGIRTNATDRVNDILKKVFGELDK